MQILTDNKEQLIKISKILLERETINSTEFNDLLAGKELEPLPPKEIKIEETEASKETKEEPVAESEDQKTDKKDESYDKG
jgi:hypothetical protein